ncbi:MAG: Holliday junction ATP-dependent DNA helicase RuvB [Candidatus Omnitrophica bacterium ADurb.Bin292]|jgi:Holliday junction DNA helicase RuvB|nr:MAG: Holliday junction ATP-dependent DNA helicase RuvB [Candidatus Omnitrophica bacterium ADurb.Bin292]HPW77296.1 Holliday junction branch migration DNA helicase RuvB [Candidatus Omnitrophota bacterium]HQB11785.1 Holliday junction branch migration DNA helicase RuvB [Candidatus Omnitrophota bacterium]
MADDPLTNEEFKPEELDLEVTLRPATLDDFVGQSQVKENLKVFIDAAIGRRESLDHILLFGPPGLGKTTLANIIAKKMEATIHQVSGPVLERAGDLAGILTNLEKGDVLFIDEIHRIPHVVEEYLYSAMEDFSIEIMIDKGPHARSVKMQIPHFTLIGATTRSGLLTAPLRSRFGIVERLNYYDDEALATIVKRSAKILEIEIDHAGAREIAGRARGTPRIANRLLRRVRDYAQVKAGGMITPDVADQGLKMLGVDKEGLDPMDKRILEYILKDCRGGPVGVNSLAVGVGEDSETIEEIYEPYLIQRGFLKRTALGRIATERAYQHFQMTPPAADQQLF